ncbi:MAG: aspartate/glutamate racemase family protein [Anaerostipes sp.]|nr:aspartate/glutamate racemase family protein [Anaerostipes sp.]
MKKEVELVNHIIYDELCLGIIKDESRETYIEIIKSLKEKGAERVILSCTEIGLLLQQKDSPLPVFDTTYIHANAAAVAATLTELKS